MGWPQYVVALWIVANSIFGIAQMLRDRAKSSGEVTVSSLVVIGIYIGLAAVLGAGGFW